MAPRGRGGGGSSGLGGSGSASCPGAFQGAYSHSTVVTFACHVVFFVLTVAVLIGMSCVRKRHGRSRKLAGPIFGLSLGLFALGYILSIIGTILTECDRISSPEYFNFAIAFNIFFNIGEFLLLVMVVYGVNTLLRSRLGSGQGAYKIICIAMLAILGLIMGAYTGLLSYNYWQNTPDGLASGSPSIAEAGQKLNFAYYLLYLFGVLGSAALASVTIVQMRAKRIPVGDLALWTGIITFCMFFWLLLMCISTGEFLDVDKLFLTVDTRLAFLFLINFFQIFSFIALLYLAKSPAWENVPLDNTNPIMYQNTTYPQQTQYAPMPPQQQQYMYVAQPGQQPMYDPPELANGNGHGHTKP